MPTRRADTSALALAETARRAQVKVRDAAVKDVTRMWAVLDFNRLRETWPTWLQGMTAILTRYHAQSADDAALFYRATRQLEVGSPGKAKLADPLPQVQVARALGYSTAHVYAKQVQQGAPPEQAQRTALTQTQGTAGRLVMDGSRSTVNRSARADSEAIGWYRITDGDPCAFCALMASRVVPMDGKRRGTLYESKGSAGADANERFTGDGLFKFHNDCACTVAPAFSHNIELNDIAKQASRIYQDRGEGDALVAFRKAWNARHAA